MTKNTASGSWRRKASLIVLTPGEVLPDNLLGCLGHRRLVDVPVDFREHPNFIWNNLELCLLIERGILEL
jgi:hypothetical protein